MDKKQITNIEVKKNNRNHIFRYICKHELGMKSAYSVRIYELLKSYAYQKSKTFGLDELKRLLMVDGIESYNRFPDFRRKVLEIAVKEINKLTDLNVSYEAIKKGRKVDKLKFRIETKESIPQLFARLETGKILDEKQK